MFNTFKVDSKSTPQQLFEVMFLVQVKAMIQINKDIEKSRIEDGVKVLINLLLD